MDVHKNGYIEIFFTEKAFKSECIWILKNEDYIELIKAFVKL